MYKSGPYDIGYGANIWPDNTVAIVDGNYLTVNKDPYIENTWINIEFTIPDNVNSNEMALVFEANGGVENVINQSDVRFERWTKINESNNSDFIPITKSYAGAVEGSWSTISTWATEFTGLTFSENNKAYTYYIEETDYNSNECDVYYSTDGTTVSMAASDIQISENGKTVTITNKLKNVSLAQAFVRKNWKDQGGNSTTDNHTSDTVTVQLYKSLRPRAGDPAAGTYSIDETTKFPVNGSGELSAPVPVGDPVVLKHLDSPSTLDNGDKQGDWEYTWNKLPNTEEQTVESGGSTSTYMRDLLYFVKEIRSSTGSISASYARSTYGLAQSDNYTDNGTSITITNTDELEDGPSADTTSVSMTKNWYTNGNQDNASHASDKVVMQLYKAYKFKSGTSNQGTKSYNTAAYKAAEGEVDHLAFPVSSGNDPEFVSYELVEEQAVPYKTADGNWNYTWSELPTTETKYFNTETEKEVDASKTGVEAVTYDLVYFVRESRTTAGASSATYSANYKVAGSAASGVTSVAITNHDTSVTASKQWVDQNNTSTNNAHATAQDEVILELWKARVKLSGETGSYDVATNADNYSQLAFVKEDIEGDGAFSGFELVEEKEVKYDSTNTRWQQEWTGLPQYETVDGKAYKLVYYVREKSTTASDVVDATYVNTYNESGNAASGISNVVITNHETSVRLDKQWQNSGGSTTTNNHQDDTATIELYKAYKLRNGGSTGNYTAAQNSTDAAFPTSAIAGTIVKYEKAGEYTLNSAKDGSEWSHTFSGLPTTEVLDGVTYDLVYYAKEIVTTAVGTTTEYGGYTYNTSNDVTSGVKQMTVTNKEDGKWKLQVSKVWSDGAEKHADDSINVQLQQTLGVSGAPEDITGKTATLNAGNNWTYTFEGLEPTVTKENTQYSISDSTLAYSVIETGWSSSAIKNPLVLATSEVNGMKQIRVTKNWAAGESPHDVIVQLRRSYTKNGVTQSENVSSEVTLTQSGQWTHAWSGDIKRTEGEVGNEKSYAYTYFVEEVSSPASDASVSGVISSFKADALQKYIAVLNNTPAYTGGMKIKKTLVGGPASITDEQKQSLMFEISYDVTETEVVGGRPQLKTTTYYGVLDSSNKLLWLTQEQIDAGNNGASNTYRKPTYKDFDTNGNYVIAENGLPANTKINVRELNAKTMFGNGYTLTAVSVTSASATVPSQSMGEIALTNTYKEVTGTITVTKDVTLNGGQKFDDVAQGQRFYVGLERLNNSTWENVTQHIKVRGGDSGGMDAPWVEAIAIGTGSTGTAVFEDLPMGTYRTYELADGALVAEAYTDYLLDEDLVYGSNTLEAGTRYRVFKENDLTTNKVYSQSEGGGGTGKNVNGYVWNVTEKGTYYTYSGNIVTSTENSFANGSNNGVILSPDGGEDHLDTRYADVALTNNKTETGSITVNKTLLRNGSPNTKELQQKTVKFRLYTDKSASEDKRAKKSDGTTVDDITVSLEHSASNHGVDGNSWGTGTFSSLPYADSNGEPITYYVFELGTNDQPITGSEATFNFDGTSRTYVVAGRNGPVELSHGSGSQVKTVDFTNSLIEKGKIKVTKQIVDEAGNVQCDATGTFRVGLFTLQDNNYVLVGSRVKEIVIEASDNGQKDVTFDYLDFDLGNDGTTYYVFEVDNQNRPVAQNNEVNGYKVEYTGDQINGTTPNTYTGQKFTLTAQNHDYDGVAPKVNGTAEEKLTGATIKNIASKSEFQIVKVDKQSWIDAATNAKDSAKRLTGAEFTMRQIKPDVEFNNPSVAYVNETTTTKAADANGVVKFEDVATGYYEIKETKSPTGYLIVGNSTVYLKVSGGQVRFLKQENNKMPSQWETATNASDAYNASTNASRNVMSYASADGSTPAVVTVGNVAGPELPSTGGPGLWPLLFAGVVLAIASAAALLFERSRA